MNPSIIPTVSTLINRIPSLNWCFLLFGALFFATSANAQLFETTLGIAATQEEAQDSKPINGGKYIVLANTQSFGPANMISLTRLTATGVQEFTVTLNDPNNPNVPYFGTAIELDFNAANAHTGYFISGYRKVGATNQIILIRTGLNGDLTWLKVLPPAISHDERSVSVERQANGDVTVVGNARNTSNGVNSFVVARFSSAGAQIYSFRYVTGSTGAPGTGFEALEACNGFRANIPVVAVTGRTNGHTFLSVINAANGTELWRRVYNSGMDRDEGTDVVYKAANGAAEPAAFMIVGLAGVQHTSMWVVRVDPIAGVSNSKIYTPGINYSAFFATAVTLDITGAKAAIAGRLVTTTLPASLNATFAMVLPFYGTELPDWTRYYEGSNPAGPGKESISRITSGGYLIGSGARLSGAPASDIHAIRVNATGENGPHGCDVVKLTPTRVLAGTSQTVSFAKTANAWTNYVVTRTQRTYKQESCGLGLTAGN